MTSILFMIISISAVSVQAVQYICDNPGKDYKLTYHDDGSITLKGYLKYDCIDGEVNFGYDFTEALHCYNSITSKDFIVLGREDYSSIIRLVREDGIGYYSGFNCQEQ